MSRLQAEGGLAPLIRHWTICEPRASGGKPTFPTCNLLQCTVGLNIRSELGLNRKYGVRERHHRVSRVLFEANRRLIMDRISNHKFEYVRKHGGNIVEGYPVEPRKDAMPDVFAWTGIASAFRKAGFVECERRSDARPIMRRKVRQTSVCR